MMAVVWFLTVFLMVSTIVAEVSPQVTNDYDYETNERPEWLPYVPNKEYIKKIYSMLDAYRAEKAERADRAAIETNAVVNTKYRTWKRNADLINSLLALPKGMNDAGRR